MSMNQRLILTVTALTLNVIAACNAGDNAYLCTLTTDNAYSFEFEEHPFVCSRAQFLSSRDSSTLKLNEATLRRYHERLLLAIEAEPYFARFQTGGQFFRTTMSSKVPAVWAVWNAHQLTPITPAVDEALRSIGASITDGPFERFDVDPQNGYLAISYRAQTPFSTKILNEVLMTAGIALDEVPAEANPYNTTFLWPVGASSEGDDLATVQIDAEITESSEFAVRPPHRLRAIVTPVSATVYDMGGEPLSDQVPPLLPTTLPWPP